MICNSWDVVVTPFPFTDSVNTKRRPALVLSAAAFNSEGFTLLAMITKAVGSNWSTDCAIDFQAAGLQTDCIVRMKLFTLDSRLIERKVGVLSALDVVKVKQSLRSILPS